MQDDLGITGDDTRPGLGGNGGGRRTLVDVLFCEFEGDGRTLGGRGGGILGGDSGMTGGEDADCNGGD